MHAGFAAGRGSRRLGRDRSPHLESQRSAGDSGGYSGRSERRSPLDGGSRLAVMSMRVHHYGGNGRGYLSPATIAASGVHQDGDGHALHQPVLVLNASYEPINVCAARRAIVLVLKGIAMTEEENGHFLHAARVAMRVPSVIRLLEYRRIPHQSRALSRK